MARSGAIANPVRVVILCLIYSMTYGISVITDQPECTEIVCPLLEDIKCPSDSMIRLIEPLAVVQEATDRGNTVSITRDRRDLVTESTTELTTEISISTPEEPIAAITIASHYDLAANLTDRCCPKPECVCKNLCNIPSCHNTSLVLIESKQRSNIPGQCCAEYECLFEPDCNEVINTKGSWLIDCQICQCLVGQKICHRSCDEIGPPPENCLSQNLKRSFSNGESWKEDECTNCECQNGEKKCLTSFCKALDCANKIKLSGECCPICAEPETTPSRSTISPSTATIVSTTTTTIRPIVVESPPSSPCDRNERIVHVIEPNSSEKCILYGIIAFLLILASTFIGLYCYARSKQRSYRPVPIFDSNFNKIKSIVTT